ncbi:DUF2484 family protein [Pseudooctadecabacter jejudonensis]|uniref:UDP-N-acetylmuramate--alanine ligase n=1 Tax=Pseudooctadecabacter jejudonensis TaxID=1391910 RepID=A0A1Y5RL78_9RHOB|nr:DUF2484 family protein [Pseudooctadecabacter jejudonensis]SLN19870.1 hypothetical protein PSJ8397_00722 [Pseudooctadecabacter jejudonensis]
MTPSAVLAIIWVLLATATALLPMRFQYGPGVALLIAAPVLIVWLGFDFGWLWVVPATLAFASMFRNPLRYFWARFRGHDGEVPK